MSKWTISDACEQRIRTRLSESLTDDNLLGSSVENLILAAMAPENFGSETSALSELVARWHTNGQLCWCMRELTKQLLQEVHKWRDKADALTASLSHFQDWRNR